MIIKIKRLPLPSALNGYGWIKIYGVSSMCQECSDDKDTVINEKDKASSLRDLLVFKRGSGGPRPLSK